MLRSLLVCALTLSPLLSTQAEDTIVVEKKAAGVPKVYLAPITSDAPLYQHAKRVLTTCGWFDLVGSSKAADYTLQFTAISQNQLKYQVLQRGGSAIPLSVQQKEQDRDLIVRRAVDQFIQMLFKTPGPCASKIAFVNTSSGKKELYTGYPDALHLAKPVTRNRTISTEPVWGKRTDQLYYTLYDQDSTNIIYLNPDRKAHARLSAFRGLNANPAISQDGNFMAMILSKDGKVELYIMNIQNRQPIRLTNNFNEEGTPCWSPDNQHLVYVSNKRGYPSLYMINIRTRRETRLSGLSGECVSPDWSPVSNKLAFAMRQGGSYKIATRDMKTGQVQIITNLTGNWESPSWAPDGRHIICSRTSGGKSLLYMIDSQTGTARALQHQNTPGMSLLPDWSPAM